MGGHFPCKSDSSKDTLSKHSSSQNHALSYTFPDVFESVRLTVIL